MIACLDLEGYYYQKYGLNLLRKLVWKNLKLTTRDIPDYDELMTKRLKHTKRK